MFRRMLLAGGAAIAMLVQMAGYSGALAQSNVCEQLGTLLKQRQSLMERVNNLGRKRVDPNVACKAFSELASNGARTIAFLKDNKEWCQVPDEFANNVNSSQGQIVKVRGQACNAAKQQATMLRQAREQQRRQAQGQDNSSFGGIDGFSGGPWRVPQGAL
ncbi:MAG: hypothetical protein NT037_10105 [Hyphomicrobiales bacterium]|nr:hypothetical protein [Hyphomicrobiales bacterium]